MTELGMDVAVVRDAAAKLDQQAKKLSALVASVDASMRSLQQVWRGPRADDAAHRWRRQYRPGLVAAAESVRGLARSLTNNVAQQERTSSTAVGLPPAQAPGWHGFASLDDLAGGALLAGGLGVGIASDFVKGAKGFSQFLGGLGMVYDASHFALDVAHQRWVDAAWDGVLTGIDGGFLYWGGRAAAVAGATAAVAAALIAIDVDAVRHFSELEDAVATSNARVSDDETIAYLQRYGVVDVGPAPGHEAEYFAIQARQAGRMAVSTLETAVAGNGELTVANRVVLGLEGVAQAELQVAWSAAQVHHQVVSTGVKRTVAALAGVL